jgi:Flp pilus assembly protein TadG
MNGRNWPYLVRNRRGQALAEFAIVLPLILMFIAAILEFGRAWNIKQAVTDAAREGARYTVVRNTLTLAQVQEKIEERLALASIDSSASAITISSSHADCAVLANCFHTPLGTGKEMTVSVSTQHRMPLVHVLLKWTGVPTSVTISTQATMRGE